MRRLGLALLLASIVNCTVSSADSNKTQEICQEDLFRGLRKACLKDYICTGCNASSDGTLLGPLQRDNILPPNTTATDIGNVTSNKADGEPEEDDPPPEIEPELLSFEQWKQKQMEVIGQHLQATYRRDNSVHEDPGADGPASSGGNTNNSDSRLPTANNSGETAQSQAAAISKPITPPALAKSSAPVHRYNYASPDCSARIHSSSPQTQHASSLLHKSKDRYMLTPCSAKEHWVIIELCDDIRIEAIELGMFEFFSGVVREVKMSVGGEDDDEDNMDDDSDEPSKKPWEEVGSFIGKNVRGAQTFTLSLPTPFHRFLRLDFPSHYGSEYYCPVSSVKVWGMNQMEAFKWESRKGRGKEEERKRVIVEEEKKRMTEEEDLLKEVLRREEELRLLREQMEAVTERSSVVAPPTSQSLPVGSSTSDFSVVPSGVSMEPASSAASTMIEVISSGSPEPTTSSTESPSTAEVSLPPTPSGIDSSATQSEANTTTTPAEICSDVKAQPSPTTSLSSTANSSMPVEMSSSTGEVTSAKSGDANAIPTSMQPSPPRNISASSYTSDGKKTANASTSTVTSAISSPTQSAPNATISLPTSSSSVATNTSSQISDSITTPSKSSAVSSFSRETTSSMTSQAATAPRASAPPVRADSSESIYAFILRRITALEGNSTLAAMYIEEQSKITRDLLLRMENKWADWNAETLERRREADQFRTTTERQINETLSRLEQHSLLMSKERVAMRSQIRQLADEVAFERKRGIVQIILTLIFAVLAVIGSAKSLESTLSPLITQIRHESRGAEKEKAKTRRIMEGREVTHPSLGKRRDTQPEDTGSPFLTKTRTLSIRPTGRRPSTPTNRGFRMRMPSNPRSADSAVKSQVPDSGPFRAPAMGVVAQASIPGRRLARSSHLHTLEADKIRQRLKAEAPAPEDGTFLTPTRAGASTLSPGTYSSQPGSAYLSLPSTFTASPMISPSPAEESSEYEDETAASASEVDEKRELTSTPRVNHTPKSSQRRRWSSPWRGEVMKEQEEESS